MKKYYFLLLVAFVLVTSCENFLNEVPKNFISPEKLYTTNAGAIAGMNGVYSNIAFIAFDRPYYLMTELSTDNMGLQTSNAERLALDKYLLTANSSNSVLRTMWERSWQVINSANDVIASLENNTSVSENIRNRILCEASFIRAFNYFNLVRFWGDLPLLTQPSKSGDDFFVKRVSKTEIYNQIIKDFQRAESLPKQSEYSSADKGRASQGAAKVYLAKVYLTLKDYQKAYSKIKEVTSTAEYDLVASYSDLFSRAYNNSKESVFAAQVIPDYNVTFSPATNFSPNPTPYNTRAYFNFNITTSLYNLFESNDIRKSLIIKGTYTVGSTNYTTNGGFAFTTKYLGKSAEEAGENKPAVNWMFTRYADVLLMLAEISNEISNSPTTETYVAINRVRTRAGLANLPIGLAKTQMFDEIDKERRRELFFEGHRWFDLVRWEKLKEKVEIDDPTVKVVIPKHYLFPLPFDAVSVNTNLLPNNPGWE